MRINRFRRFGERLVFVATFFCLSSLALASPTWEKIPAPGADPWRTILPHPLEPKKMIVASSHEIFEGDPRGPWRSLWHLRGQNHTIRRLLYFEEVPKALFILTDRGLFRFDLTNRKSSEIFRGKSRAEQSILSFAILPEDPDHWFLGTKAGLFESDDAGRTWFRFEKFLEREPIPILAMTRDQLFLSTSERLYVSDDLASFRPVFSLESGDDAEFLEIEEVLGEFQEVPMPAVPNLNVLIHSGDGERLWLGTRKGVFESEDGRHWRPLSRSGFRSAEVGQLVWSPKSRGLIAATSHGIYRFLFSSGRWQELYKGLARPETHGLAVLAGEPEILVAATAEGLMRYPLLQDGVSPVPFWHSGPDKLRLFQELLRLEPTARQLHQAVVKYGDLTNAKIKRWHAESRLASLLPTFSFGRDFSKANNIDLDRGGTVDRDQFIVGPEEEDAGWDADVSWDLGDFIWSTSQTSIDSREKLMVELRNDLLAEATRIYYERRRLQMEIVFDEPVLRREHLEKLVRMDELTALLDAMTDGYFSQKLKEIYRRNPELNGLWE